MDGEPHCLENEVLIPSESCRSEFVTPAQTLLTGVDSKLEINHVPSAPSPVLVKASTDGWKSVAPKVTINKEEAITAGSPQISTVSQISIMTMLPNPHDRSHVDVSEMPRNEQQPEVDNSSNTEICVTTSVSLQALSEQLPVTESNSGTTVETVVEDFNPSDASSVDVCIPPAAIENQPKKASKAPEREAESYEPSPFVPGSEGTMNDTDSTGTDMSFARSSIDECHSCDTAPDIRMYSSEMRAHRREENSPAATWLAGSTANGSIAMDDSFEDCRRHKRSSRSGNIWTTSTNRVRDRPKRADGVVMWSELAVERQCLTDAKSQFESIQLAWREAQQFSELEGVLCMSTYDTLMKDAIVTSYANGAIAYANAVDLYEEFQPVLQTALARLTKSRDKKVLQELRKTLGCLQRSSQVAELIAQHPMEDDENDADYKPAAKHRPVKRRRL
jgi:hypothetical protein